MEDPTKTPEPTIKRKTVETHRPTCDVMKEMKAQMWGYNERYSKIVGESQQLKHHWTEPVAFDTNKTRRTMVKPTKAGTYK